jgi:protein-S-isoprenylcysteine O-methyltransferase Ste14
MSGYPHLITALWLSWALYWWISSRNTKETQRYESAASRASHLIPLAAAICLLALPSDRNPFSGRFVPPSLAGYWLGVALLTAGLVFAVWARLHLGSNWSGMVTLKREHALVLTGPYRWVRHPIYTGLLLALLGTAIARGDWSSLIAVALCAASFIRKIGIEERWLRELFKDEYDRYSARVPALIPLIY